MPTTFTWNYTWRDTMASLLPGFSFIFRLGAASRPAREQVETLVLRGNNLIAMLSGAPYLTYANASPTILKTWPATIKGTCFHMLRWPYPKNYTILCVTPLYLQ